MTRRFLLLLLIAITTLMLASCRAGVIDPEALESFPKAPASYALDEFDDSRTERASRTLYAGAAAVDISPYNYYVWISGYGAGRLSRGVADPVYARALFLDDGEESIVFLSLDLTGLLLPDVNRIRDLVTQRRPHRVLIGSTHNHQAPDTMGYWGFGPAFPMESGIVEEYQEEMIQKAAQAIRQAIANARPAAVAFGSRRMPETYSINLWFPDDPTRKDDELSTIRVEDRDGGTIATLVNWACHPEALLNNRRKISAEFPGQFYRINEEMGGGVGLFFPGAIGGMIAPSVNRMGARKQWDHDARLDYNERLGRELALSAARSVVGSKRYVDRKLNIEVHRREITIPVDSPLFELAARSHVIGGAERIADPDHPELVTEIYAVSMGRAMIATVPGEAFPSIGFSVKGRMTSRYHFLFGLVSDELGYLMRDGEFDDPIYRYEARTSLGRRAGPIVEDAVISLLDAVTIKQDEDEDSLGLPGLMIAPTDPVPAEGP